MEYITYAPMFWKDQLEGILAGDGYTDDQRDYYIPDHVEQNIVDKWGAERRALLSVREDFIVCKTCGSNGEITLPGKKRETCPKCEGSGYENFRE